MSVTAVCSLLGLPRSSYYARRRAAAKRPVEPILEAAVRELHAQSRHAIGSRRLSAGLRLRGHRVGRFKARSLIRQLALPIRRRPNLHCRRYTKPDAAAPNTLGRQYDPAEQDRFWAGDITQLLVGGKWLYMAIVMDLFSRRIVGWAYSHIADARLAETALSVAVAVRQPQAGLLFHSDQGCQYSAERFVSYLPAHGILQSMSRRGNCWDNAVVERFFRTLKHEWVPPAGYSHFEQAEKDLTDFIIYYNHERPHSRLNDVPPALFEQMAA